MPKHFGDFKPIFELARSLTLPYQLSLSILTKLIMSGNKRPREDFELVRRLLSILHSSQPTRPLTEQEFSLLCDPAVLHFEHALKSQTWKTCSLIALFVGSQVKQLPYTATLCLLESAPAGSSFIHCVANLLSKLPVTAMHASRTVESVASIIQALLPHLSSWPAGAEQELCAAAAGLLLRLLTANKVADDDTIAAYSTLSNVYRHWPRLQESVSSNREGLQRAALWCSTAAQTIQHQDLLVTVLLQSNSQLLWQDKATVQRALSLLGSTNTKTRAFAVTAWSFITQHGCMVPKGQKKISRTVKDCFDPSVSANTCWTFLRAALTNPDILPASLYANFLRLFNSFLQLKGIRGLFKKCTKVHNVSQLQGNRLWDSLIADLLSACTLFADQKHTHAAQPEVAEQLGLMLGNLTQEYLNVKDIALQMLCNSQLQALLRRLPPALTAPPIPACIPSHILLGRIVILVHGWRQKCFACKLGHVGVWDTAKALSVLCSVTESDMSTPELKDVAARTWFTVLRHDENTTVSEHTNFLTPAGLQLLLHSQNESVLRAVTLQWTRDGKHGHAITRLVVKGLVTFLDSSCNMVAERSLACFGVSLLNRFRSVLVRQTFMGPACIQPASSPTAAALLMAIGRVIRGAPFPVRTVGKPTDLDQRIVKFCTTEEVVRQELRFAQTRVGELLRAPETRQHWLQQLGDGSPRDLHPLALLAWARKQYSNLTQPLYIFAAKEPLEGADLPVLVRGHYQMQLSAAMVSSSSVLLEAQQAAAGGGPVTFYGPRHLETKQLLLLLHYAETIYRHHMQAANQAFMQLFDQDPALRFRDATELCILADFVDDKHLMSVGLDNMVPLLQANVQVMKAELLHMLGRDADVPQPVKSFISYHLLNRLPALIAADAVKGLDGLHGPLLDALFVVPADW